MQWPAPQGFGYGSYPIGLIAAREENRTQLPVDLLNLNFRIQVCWTAGQSSMFN